MDLVVDALHVLAACVWVGGSITVVAVAVPYGRRLPPRERALLLAGLGRRWRPLGWSALAVLLVTGIAAAHEHGGFAEPPFGRLLVAKVAVVGALLLVASAPASGRRAARVSPSAARVCC